MTDLSAATVEELEEKIMLALTWVPPGHHALWAEARENVAELARRAAEHDEGAKGDGTSAQEDEWGGNVDAENAKLSAQEDDKE